MDLFWEEAYSHNFVKNALYLALAPLAENLGPFFSDGMLLTNEDAGIATEPDAMFGSTASLEWVSAVLGKSFRPTQSAGADGNPVFAFEYR